MLKSVLIANSGEIACRVIRSAKAMGMRTITVYSDADADALHVKQADEAWYLGPAPAAESYLRADKILAIALEAKADCVHPGYGFLSENAAFARAVEKAGLVLVGPSPEAMEMMGNKLSAKAAKPSVPCVPS